jgi:hypothetical protein
MTFWEQYKIYLRERWLSGLIMSAALNLTPLVIKYLTGKHHMLDKFVTEANLPYYALGSVMGLFIAFPLISALLVYFERKYPE